MSGHAPAHAGLSAAPARGGIEQRAWIASYALVLALPMLLLAAAPEAGSAMKQFAVSLGFATFMGMCVQVVLAARVPALARSAGVDVLLRVHRLMGSLLLFVIITHVVFFTLQRGTNMLEWLLLLDRQPKAWTGAAGFWGMVLLAVTSIWRARLGWSYERWRLWHIAFTALALFGAYLHMLTSGDYATWQPIRLVVTDALVVAIAAAVYVRVGRAFGAATRPYVLEQVRPERGDAVTLRLRADGHGGIVFRPGDVAWLRIGGSPYAITEHPFSVASSTLRPGHVEFTCKVVGDRTSSLVQLPLGTTVYVDGPHGAWHAAAGAPGFLLVSAGIGITPAMSVIRTLADDPARRATPVTLVHGARSLDDVTFREELEQLAGEGVLPNLRVHLALTNPPVGWQGHHGRIEGSLLRRAAGDAARAGHEVFACGPLDLLELVQQTMAQLGVPAARVHVERFEGV